MRFTFFYSHLLQTRHLSHILESIESPYLSISFHTQIFLFAVLLHCRAESPRRNKVQLPYLFIQCHLCHQLIDKGAHIHTITGRDTSKNSDCH